MLAPSASSGSQAGISSVMYSCIMFCTIDYVLYMAISSCYLHVLYHVSYFV
jgi:hypothetical protein